MIVQSGAGLVADSVPANEFDETINKARGLLKAVTISEIVEDENSAPTKHSNVPR